MLVNYAIGLLAARVKSPLGLAVFCALANLVVGMMFGVEGGRAILAAGLYFVLSLGWFWLLVQLQETIFLWFLVFIPGPIVLSFAVAAIDVAMHGKSAPSALS